LKTRTSRVLTVVRILCTRPKTKLGTLNAASPTSPSGAAIVAKNANRKTPVVVAAVAEATAVVAAVADPNASFLTPPVPNVAREPPSHSSPPKDVRSIAAIVSGREGTKAGPISRKLRTLSPASASMRLTPIFFGLDVHEEKEGPWLGGRAGPEHDFRCD
jgi:hypothetical protein